MKKVLVLGLICLFLVSSLLAQTSESKKEKTIFLRENSTVYVKPNGRIFHLKNCEHLGIAYTGMSLKYAFERGHKPCPACILSKKDSVISSFIDEKFLGKKISKKPKSHKPLYMLDRKSGKFKSYRDLYLEDHPKLSKRIRDAIKRSDILIGMTRNQVIASRGQAHKINTSTIASGTHEQWVMHSKEPKYTQKYGYIYFENGIVTGWQSR